MKLWDSLRVLFLPTYINTAAKDRFMVNYHAMKVKDVVGFTA